MSLQLSAVAYPFVTYKNQPKGAHNCGLLWFTLVVHDVKQDLPFMQVRTTWIFKL